MREAEKKMFDELVKSGKTVVETRVKEGSTNYCQNAHKSDITIIGKRGKETNVQLKNGRSGSVQIRAFRRHTYFKGLRNEPLFEICEFIGKRWENHYEPLRLKDYFPLNKAVRELLIKGNNFIPAVSNPDIYLYKIKTGELVEVSIKALYHSCMVYRKAVDNNWQDDDWKDEKGAFQLQFKSLEKDIRDYYKYEY